MSTTLSPAFTSLTGAVICSMDIDPVWDLQIYNRIYMILVLDNHELQRRGIRDEHLLTHWGRVTHICVSKRTIIGSDNGLSPDRRQANIWTNAGILLIVPMGNKFQWNLNRNWYIFIQETAFVNVVRKLAAILSRLQWAKCYTVGVVDVWEDLQVCRQQEQWVHFALCISLHETFWIQYLPLSIDYYFIVYTMVR